MIALYARALEPTRDVPAISIGKIRCNPVRICM